MNIYSRKCKYSIFVLVVLFAVAQAAKLQAQNVEVHGTNRGATYSAVAGDSGGMIRFTQDGAKVTYQGPPNDLIWTGIVVMESSGTFQINDYTVGGTTHSSAFILNSALTGSGDFIKTGSGTFVLGSDSSTSFSGGIIIEQGTFRVGTAGLLSPDSAIRLAGGTLDISIATTHTTQTIASLAGHGTVALGSNTLKAGNETNTIFEGIFEGTGTFEKIGDGTLFINNNTSAFSGTIRVTEGTLGGSGYLSRVVVGAGATLAPGTGSTFPEAINISNLTLNNGSTLQIRADADEKTDKVIGNVTINSGANLLIDALPGDYSVLREYNGFIVGGAPLYGNFNLDIIQKFLAINWKNGVPAQGFTIGRKENYFNDLTYYLTHNQREVGKALDRAGGSLWDVMTQLSNGKSPELFQNAFNQIAGDLRANSMMLGQWQTSRYGLNHLDLTNCGTSQGNGVWLEFIHQTTDFNSDGNSDSYGISRTGFLIGSEERRVDTVYGFFVGYSYPFLYDHGNKVEAGDLQFGFYGGSKVAEVLETKLFVGYGHQGYKSKRYIDHPLLVDTRERIDGKYDGDSMSMSLEFAVPLSSGIFCLRPVVAMDSDLTWQYGFGETGNTGLELRYNREFMDRSFLRTGLTAQLGSVDRCDTLALLTRAYYGHQVFGDPYPESRSRFLEEDDRMTIHGVNPGRDYVDLGIGLHWNIDAHRSFYGDYDYSAFSRSNAHWGTIGFMQRW